MIQNKENLSTMLHVKVMRKIRCVHRARILIMLHTQLSVSLKCRGKTRKLVCKARPAKPRKLNVQFSVCHRAPGSQPPNALGLNR